MKSKIIALCDTDKIFCDRFLNYYMKHKVFEIEFVTYTSVEELLKDTHQNNISSYLLTEDFWISELCEDKNKNVIYFSKDHSGKSTGLENDHMDFEKHIYKYQSMDAIFRELFRIESENTQKSVILSSKEWKEENVSGGKIISVFSPSNEDIQSYISLCMAKQLGNEKKVLYLNLIENAGMEQLFEEKFEEDISDFFYVLQQKKGDLQKRLQGLVYHTKEFDYIPAAFQAKGLYELSEEDQAMFFLYLRSLKYDVILIDFGNSIIGMEELIKESDCVYCLTREHWTAQIRMNHFKKAIAYFSMEQEKINICAVPMKVNTLSIKQGSLLEIETPEIALYANKMLHRIVW